MFAARKLQCASARCMPVVPSSGVSGQSSPTFSIILPQNDVLVTKTRLGSSLHMSEQPCSFSFVISSHSSSMPSGMFTIPSPHTAGLHTAPAQDTVSVMSHSTPHSRPVRHMIWPMGSVINLHVLHSSSSLSHGSPVVPLLELLSLLSSVVLMSLVSEVSVEDVPVSGPLTFIVVPDVVEARLVIVGMDSVGVVGLAVVPDDVSIVSVGTVMGMGHAVTAAAASARTA
jgi:hypothetical protein